jgi:hypothetical protein
MPFKLPLKKGVMRLNNIPFIIIIGVLMLLILKKIGYKIVPILFFYSDIELALVYCKPFFT